MANNTQVAPATFSIEAIRTDNGLYSLNDLHKAAGGENKHSPRYWQQNQQTQDLIQELLKDGNPSLEQNQKVIKTVRGGERRGTYVCKELVCAYAAWISPAFHLVVIRSFLEQHGEDGQPETPRRTTPDERAGLRQAVTMLTTKRGLMHDEAYRLIHQRFNVSHIEEIPAEQLPQAIEYIHRLALEGELLPPPEDKDAGYIRSHQVAAIGLMHVGRLRFEEQKKALLRLRDLTAQAHERLKATLAETRATLDLTNDILYGSGAIWDGLHESLFHLMLPDEVMDEGRNRAQKHYKPRILA